MRSPAELWPRFEKILWDLALMSRVFVSIELQCFETDVCMNVPTLPLPELLGALCMVTYYLPWEHAHLMAASLSSGFFDGLVGWLSARQLIKSQNF